MNIINNITQKIITTKKQKSKIKNMARREKNTVHLNKILNEKKQRKKKNKTSKITL